MSFPILTILPVGQGNCSLIEVYNRDPKGLSGATLEFLAMVDCGVITRSSGGMNTQNIIESKKYIKEKMNARWKKDNPTEPKTKTPYYLDCFILTHQDNDHWSILSQMLHKDILDIKNKSWYSRDNKNYFYRNKTSNVINYKKITDIEEEGKQIEQIYQIIDIKLSGLKVEELSYYKIIKEDTENYRIELCCKTEYSKLIKVELDSNEWSKWLNVCNHWNENCEKLNNTKEEIKSILYKKLDDKENSNIYEPVIDYLIKNIKEANENFWKKDKFNTISSKKLESYIISKFYYGGIQYGPAALGFRYLVDLLAEIKKNFAIKPGDTVSFDTSGKKEIKFTVLSRLDDLPIIKSTEDYIFEAESGSDISILRNASSAVTLWEVCGQKYLMTGDATAHTFYYLTENDVALKKLAACHNCIMTAPHHGSDNTSKGKEKEDGEDDYQILGDFLTKVNPAAIVVSAGYQSEFQHPGSAFIKKCIDSNPLPSDLHLVYLFKQRGDPQSHRYHSLSRNIYTTVTADVDPSSSTHMLSPTYTFYAFQNSTVPESFNRVVNTDMINTKFPNPLDKSTGNKRPKHPSLDDKIVKKPKKG